MKSTWNAHMGEMVFTLPDHEQHTVVRADRIDHPDTLCKLLDTAMELNPFERRLFVTLLAEMELRQMYPDGPVFVDEETRQRARSGQ